MGVFRKTIQPYPKPKKAPAKYVKRSQKQWLRSNRGDPKRVMAGHPLGVPVMPRYAVFHSRGTFEHRMVGNTRAARRNIMHNRKSVGNGRLITPKQTQDRSDFRSVGLDS